MPRFPLSVFPNQDWYGGTGFGAKRPGGRFHAGCDLITEEGKEVLSVADGTVLVARPFSIPYLPSLHLFQVVIDHRFFQARYCELRNIAKGIGRGVSVKEGQVIGFVGKLKNHSMLHFEMYKGDSKSDLTVRSNHGKYLYVPPKDYQRRFDLLDPTKYLDIWSSII